MPPVCWRLPQGSAGTAISLPYKKNRNSSRSWIFSLVKASTTAPSRENCSPNFRSRSSGEPFKIGVKEPRCLNTVWYAPLFGFQQQHLLAEPGKPSPSRPCQPAPGHSRALTRRQARTHAHAYCFHDMPLMQGGKSNRENMRSLRSASHFSLQM